YRTNNIAETTASAAAVTSMTATRPSCRVTPAINASHATLIPSSRAPAHGDRRRRRMNGWLAATKTNAGKKMATVAATTPPHTAQQVSDEGGGGEDRPGGELADGDRVQQLPIGQPPGGAAQSPRTPTCRSHS